MEDDPMQFKTGLALAVLLTAAICCGARAQEVFVLGVQGKVFRQKNGGEGRSLERGFKLPMEGKVEIGPGGSLQIMGASGRLAHFEGPCVKPVTALASSLQQEQSRTLAKAFGNLWDKFKGLWREEGDLDSSGGTRGTPSISRAPNTYDRLKNPPGTEIVLVAPRGGYVLGDTVTFTWVSGGVITPQTVRVFDSKLEVVCESEVKRTTYSLARTRLAGPSGGVYIWGVEAPGCNPDQAFFRVADPARAREVQQQAARVSAVTGDDVTASHLLRAQTFEDAECYADACREYLAAATIDDSGTSRELLDQFVMEKLGLSRRVADELFRVSSKGR
jgi:hypothetical protein